jgi:hypothetical protein
MTESRDQTNANIWFEMRQREEPTRRMTLGEWVVDIIIRVWRKTRKLRGCCPYCGWPAKTVDGKMFCDWCKRIV